MLSSDELASLVDARPRLEKEVCLPGDAVRGEHIFMFSIDGTLMGERYLGCLFAGEAMLVQAKDFPSALKTARDGLKDTIHLLHAERAQRSVVELANHGISIDTAGRRLNGAAPHGLARDPKMRAILGHLIGGLPWKW